MASFVILSILVLLSTLYTSPIKFKYSNPVNFSKASGESGTNPNNFFYIYDGLQAFHPETLDEAYKERKKDDVRKFQSLFSTFGIVDTLPGDIKPGTGMYDEK